MKSIAECIVPMKLASDCTIIGPLNMLYSHWYIGLNTSKRIKYAFFANLVLYRRQNLWFWCLKKVRKVAQIGGWGVFFLANSGNAPIETFFFVLMSSLRLFAAPDGSPHENGHNSGTKSRKLLLLPEAPKRPDRRGLKTVHWRKSRSHIKKRIFGPKTVNFGPKKGTHFLTLSIFRPRPGKVVKRKKLPFPK